MSDVIEVMAWAIDDGIGDFPGYRQDVIKALRAAERAGWRLVPVEPTEEMCVNASRGHDMAPAEHWELMLEAAPRPWEED